MTEDARVGETLQAGALRGIGARPRLHEWLRPWRRFFRHRLSLVGAVIVLVLLIAAIFPQQLAPYDPYTTESRTRGETPSWEHPLGRDEVGRDILSRLIYGTRVALLVGLGATAFSGGVGVLVGAVAGFFGGRVDTILSRLVDTFMAFPDLILIMVFVALIGPNLANAMLGIIITMWAQYARLVRAEVLSLREREFIVAARAVGVRTPRILFRHVLPNVMGPVIVLATLNIATAILLESSLSFIGLGVQPPEPSWGLMLATGRAYILKYPHLVTFPGVAIAITVLGFNFLGEGLRDFADPRSKLR
ncbi:MAG: ABC transporter permease [Ardenticatenaceae bacterium]|nr:ABC transporter permease [Ardenticatenaceae bacterium]HBY97292.1 peptide ABC transporter permease [Chloroflexota bacterium]